MIFLLIDPVTIKYKPTEFNIVNLYLSTEDTSKLVNKYFYQRSLPLLFGH